MFTGLFWKDALERAIRTFCQSALGVLTVGSSTLLDADWTGVLSVAGMAFLLSFLTSLAATGRGISTNASLLDIDPVDPPGRHAADNPRRLHDGRTD